MSHFNDPAFWAAAIIGGFGLTIALICWWGARPWSAADERRHQRRIQKMKKE